MLHAHSRAPWASRVLVASALAVGSLTAIAGPSVSIPSTPDITGKVNVRGTAVAAYSNVTVRFIHDKMTPVDLVAQAAANGSFTVKFEPPITGAYSVIVFDSAGKQIGSGSFGHFR